MTCIHHFVKVLNPAYIENTDSLVLEYCIYCRAIIVSKYPIYIGE